MNQSSSSDVSVCPVCGKTYELSIINTHVNACLNMSSSPLDKTQSLTKSHKRKSNETPNAMQAWGFLKDASSVSKKMKVSHNQSKSFNIEDLKQPDLEINNLGNVCEETTTNMFKNVKLPKKVENCSASSNKTKFAPLAEIMRPLNLDEYVGQTKAVGKGSLLYSLLQTDHFPSMILWGPPGCGKTTLAHIISTKCKDSNNIKFVSMSATTSGVGDVKKMVTVAKNDQKMFKKKTILFLDEVHRFNKLQQDSLLPHVEDGTITLIGATTENPSFQVNSALLSRCRVIVLDKLSSDDLYRIVSRAVKELGADVLDHSSNNVDEAKSPQDDSEYVRIDV